ncbi:glycosyltransferase [Desulfobacterales bacterium HSG17]|nr:glycosyltransferase [Desulfobacterales bacterium HSG17]
MINILHVIDTTGPGGAETVFLNLVSKLDRSRFCSYVVISGKGWVYDQLTKDSIELLICSSKGSFNFKYLLQLIKIIRRLNIDVIHSHLLGSNVYSCVAGFLCNVPVVTTFHGFVDSQNVDKWIKARFFLINNFASRIVFVSHHLKKYFVSNRGADVKKSVVIYNGINLNYFKPQVDNSIRQEIGLSTDDFVIGSIGNIREAKGYEDLLRCAAVLKDAGFRCKFLIAGQGAGPIFDQLLKLRKSLQLCDIVEFLGFRDDTVALLNAFDIFLLPSISEGFSIATIEAMACGVTTIVTKSGGPEEIVVDGENGIMVPPNDFKKMAQELMGLIDNKKKRYDLGRYALESVRFRFTDKAMVASYEVLYKHLEKNNT